MNWSRIKAEVQSIADFLIGIIPERGEWVLPGDRLPPMTTPSDEPEWYGESDMVPVICPEFIQVTMAWCYRKTPRGGIGWFDESGREVTPSLWFDIPTPPRVS